MPNAFDASPAGIRYDWLLVLVVVAAVFAAYGYTAPRTVTLEDDGLFIMASFDLGVAHPPGYPLYTLLGHIATYLPIGTPALRVHLLSGLLGALACGVLFLVARQTGLPRWFALAAALAYGVSEHLWSQAIIAEVYTLNVLLTFVVLLFCLRAMAATGPTRQRQKTIVRELSFAALCFGLGLANHWPLLLLAAPAFVILLLPSWSLVWRNLPRLFALVIVPALLLYLWMVWRSWQPGLVAFYGPISSPENFWYYVSRQGYGGVDSSPSAGLVDKAAFTWHFLKESFFLLSPLGALLALAGIYRLHQNKRTHLLAATAWIFIAHSLILILALGFDYEHLNVAVYRPYPLVSYGILAYWMAQGLTLITDMLGRPGRSQQQATDGTGDDDDNKDSDDNKRRGGSPTSFLLKALPALALLIPAFVLQKNLEVNDRSQDRFAERYGRMLLDSLDPDAVLFVVGDTTTAPLGYLHYVEGVRSDVQLINTQGLVYPTRLFIPPTTKRKRENAFATFMRNNRRPVYTINKIAEIPNPDGTIHYGFYQKIDPQGRPGAITLRFAERATDYFDSIARAPTLKDRWNRHQQTILMQQYGNFLGYTILSDDPELKRVAADKVKIMENQYYGLVDMAEVLIEFGSTAEHLKIAQELLQQAEPLVDETLTKSMKGRHHYRLGFLAYRLRNYPEAHKQFAESVKHHDHPDNPSQGALEMFRRAPGSQQR